MNILLTGATGGVGRHVLRALLQRGHRVFAAGRNPKTLFALQRELPKTELLELLQLDLTDEESIHSAREEVLFRTRSYGLDAIIHAAGMAEVGPLMTITPAALERHLQTNALGPLLLNRVFLPEMKDRRAGRIVHVGAIVNRLTLATHGAYGASVHALRAIADVLRQELSVFGISVGLLETGSIKTPFVRDAFLGLDAKRWSGSRWNSVIDRLEKLQPLLERVGVEPEEVAEALVAFALDSKRGLERVAGFSGAMQIAASRLLSEGLFDELARRTVALRRSSQVDTAPAPGSRALLTGAGGGMGSVATLELARRGYKILATDVDHAALEALHERAKAAGVTIETREMDVTSGSSIGQALGQDRDFSILVDCAGVAQAGPLDLIESDRLRHQIDVNVIGLLRVVRAVAPSMCESGRGRIITLSSIAGQVAAPFFGAYNASEFAVSALTSALRQELAHFGVGVSMVSPGFVATGLITAARASLAEMDPREWSPLFAQADLIVERLRRAGGSAKSVGRAIGHTVAQESPPARVQVPGRVQLLSTALPLAPRSLRDLFFHETFGLRQVERGLR